MNFNSKFQRIMIKFQLNL